MTRKITTSALMIALAVGLALLSNVIPLKLWPNGGSITLASMVPIIVVSILFDLKWGLLSSLTYAGLQMLLGFYPPPVQDFQSFLLVVLLDYVLAFGVLGLAGYFYRVLGKKRWALPVSVAIVTGLRYVCHILSGMLIWKVYAPEGQGAFVYSVTYNGTFMLPEMIISVIVVMALSKYINQFSKER